MIEGHEEEVKNNYYLQLSALQNAIGSCFGGKSFKMNDPFKTEEKKAESKKMSREEMFKDLLDLQARFK